ncbi:hypothetical protein T230_05780 [Tannerella sp. oral taxon BU063 isolate Cell 1/3]|uniref:Uncharacterized protein n=1 Tax=Tannerella sp. oral taxon BU063 isolate Cell 1/3 TaxID=1411022 RepID=W2CRI6_9BACT|nr:hypothetical protein T230_05780 [Tannerella sp. oral taxon BU063 isolate Cell 1/3]
MRRVLRPFLGVFNTLRNVVKYRSEVVIITFRTSLNMVQDVIKYPAEPY